MITGKSAVLDVIVEVGVGVEGIENLADIWWF
jgi:hypothetical protein